MIDALLAIKERGFISQNAISSSKCKQLGHYFVISVLSIVPLSSSELQPNALVIVPPPTSGPPLETKV